MSTPDWLAAGGETAGLIRARDWSSTPLGPWDRWPQSLRSALSVCLGSRFPIVIYWGAEFTVLYNDAYAAILGGKHPRALGEPCRQVWAEIWDVIEPMLSGVRATGEATWSEDQLLILHRNGYPEECYFSFSFGPIRAEGGDVGGVFTAVIEHTQRVLSERRLRTLRELADRTAEAKSDATACESAAAVLAGDPRDVPFSLVYLLDGETRRARLASTSGIAAVDGAPPGNVELAADTTPWRLAAAMAQTQVITDLRRRLMPTSSGPWPDAPDAAVVLPLLAGGQSTPAGLLVAGVSPRRPLDEGYRSFFTLVASNIATAVGNARAYAQERQRAEALAEIDRTKTRFLSNASHELRTPLTLILSPVEDLLATPGERLSPDARALLDVVKRNGLRLQKLVNALLEFSRLEAGRVQAVFAPTDLGALTAELASNFQSACERAGLRLVVDCPPCDEPVHVDRDMWETIVLNLVSNAFKFTFEGEIAVAVRDGDRTVELTVRDTGTGIAPEELQHIFERFHRVKNARGRTYEGAGIGLALVRELVTLHGGTIAVSSVVDQGTVFRVSIPKGTAHLPADRIGGTRSSAAPAAGVSSCVEEALRWLPDPEPSADRASLPSRSGSTGPPTGAARAPGNGGRARILWADDNADMREYVGRLLDAQYDVEPVSDGQAALAAARAHPPDLVLADVMMPLVDGFDLLRELRAAPETRTLPVILLSARAGEESRVEGLAAGADDYLIKPFSARELLARVSARLEIARLRRAAESTERALRQRLEAQMRAKDQFLAMLGHELRNPLAAVVGAIGVLDLTAPADDVTAQARAIIRRQTAYLTRLLDDLLDVARLDTGKIELKREPVDLRATAEHALNALAEGGKAGRHAVSLTGEPLWVYGDPTRLEQVIFNLLDNAVKYTPRDGRITVTVEAEGGSAALRVRDNGVGMTPDVLARAFEPFVQGSPTLETARGGLGLGLTVVKRLVELHGGTVTAHSAGPGHGSEILVRLPLTEAPHGPAGGAPGAPAAGPRRVLLVDDNEDMRTTLRKLLELGGHHVAEAADSTQGLEMLTRLRPDVALIDLGLPGPDGYALTKAARQAPEGEAFYLVAVTGYGQPEDRRRALEAGFDAYLVKPVHQADLARLLAASPVRPRSSTATDGDGSGDGSAP